MQVKPIARHLERDNGIALLTVLLMLMVLTVLGMAAITITGLENRMSGFFRSGEAVVAAADSCEGTAANIIQQTMMPPGILPPSFLDDASPAGPVPQSNAATLQAEIKGEPLPSPPAAANTPSENYTDTAIVVPNFTLTTMPGFVVNGDIDRLYKVQTTGTASSVNFVYRITCVATNAATGASSTVTSVYSCTENETCIKQIN